MTRGTRPWRAIRQDHDAEALTRVEQIKRGMEDSIALAELRDRFDVTQTELASRMGTNQPSVSRLERREDLYLSTLREYVRALGGELELVARFPDEDVRIEPAREAVAVG